MNIVRARSFVTYMVTCCSWIYDEKLLISHGMKQSIDEKSNGSNNFPTEAFNRHIWVLQTKVKRKSNNNATS